MDANFHTQHRAAIAAARVVGRTVLPPPSSPVPTAVSVLVVRRQKGVLVFKIHPLWELLGLFRAGKLPTEDLSTQHYWLSLRIVEVWGRDDRYESGWHTLIRLLLDTDVSVDDTIGHPLYPARRRLFRAVETYITTIVELTRVQIEAELLEVILAAQLHSLRSRDVWPLKPARVETELSPNQWQLVTFLIEALAERESARTPLVDYA
jgi:hypothetical protein